MFDSKVILLNGPKYMSEAPVPRDPGQDEDPRPAPPWPAWMDDPAYLASRAGDEDPGDPHEYDDPDNTPPPGLEDAELEALLAEATETTAEQARAAEGWAQRGQAAVVAAVGAMCAGRRGPEMPGSAQSFPGEYAASAAAGFASGEPLDVAPGCPVLAQFAENAAGPGDRYAGVSDDELLGVICAWDRVEANASARKHAAVAELIRRRPAPGAAVDGQAELPESWHEFTGRELGAVLGVAAGDAEQVLDLAWALEVNLAGTRAAFRAGVLSRDKAAVIAGATALLDPAEARAAEGMVLGQVGSLTLARLRAAIQRAVMEVNPGKAKKRREHAAKRARVERWFEDSGNAGLAGRELPPAEVLAADQRRPARWLRHRRTAAKTRRPAEFGGGVGCAGRCEGDDNALGRAMYLSTAVSPALDTSMSCILRIALWGSRTPGVTNLGAAGSATKNPPIVTCSSSARSAARNWVTTPARTSCRSSPGWTWSGRALPRRRPGGPGAPSRCCGAARGTC